MPFSRWFSQSISTVCIASLLGGCASTIITLQPSPQPPVCSTTTSALVLWSTQWRPDQKDVLAREDAAATGLKRFFTQSGCFANVELQRVTNMTPPSIRKQLSGASHTYSKVVGIKVKELGPIVKLLASAVLFEGGTQVVLHVSEYSGESGAALREFSVHWQNGGAGVIKGVESLPDDMQSALHAGLQPEATGK